MLLCPLDVPEHSVISEAGNWESERGRPIRGDRTPFYPRSLRFQTRRRAQFVLKRQERTPQGAFYRLRVLRQRASASLRMIVKAGLATEPPD